MLLLAGDIGGTKTVIYSAEGGPRKPLAQAEFQSQSYPSLEAIVKEFLAKIDQPVDRACFCNITGPVIARSRRRSPICPGRSTRPRRGKSSD